MSDYIRTINRFDLSILKKIKDEKYIEYNKKCTTGAL